MNNTTFNTNSIYAKNFRPNFWLDFLTKAVVTICFIFSIFLLGFTVVYDNAPVYGVSMQPTLNKLGGTKSDLVYINKFAKIDYGDIVVVEKLEDNETNYIIKRVIGLPGDIIEIMEDDGEIYVFRNGTKLVEDYILNVKLTGDPNNLGMKTTLDNFNALKKLEQSKPQKTIAEFDQFGRLIVQPEQVFVLGDNRGNSIDSSVDGPFLMDNVVGRVDHVIPYGTKAYEYFVEYYTGINWFK